MNWKGIAASLLIIAWAFSHQVHRQFPGRAIVRCSWRLYGAKDIWTENY